MQPPSAKEIKYANKLKSILSKRGYQNATKVIDTLQGTIWRGISAKTGKRVVIKITSKDLASKSIMVDVDGTKRPVHENILREKAVLKYLTNGKNCVNSIVKYTDFMKSNVNYYLVMEDGGRSLFDFNLKVHEYVEAGKIRMAHWHSLCRVMFRRMVECLEYMHSMKVCHFDVSLENFLLNDLSVEYNEDATEMTFVFDEEDDATVQVKLCDFGLAECFAAADQKAEETDFRTKKFCGKQTYQSPEISNFYGGTGLFDAAKNDIWCLGVSLFMLITGSAPFESSAEEDPYFQLIINGKMKVLLESWGKSHYVNEPLLALFRAVFKYEADRASIADIKNSKWLRSE